MSWTYQLLVHGNGGKWSNVNMRFETEAEAREAGLMKFTHWTMCDDYRVVEIPVPANYRRIDDENVEIPTLARDVLGPEA